MLLKSWSMRRNQKPRRRVPQRNYKDYGDYKKWLREDFVCRCGYCSIHENEHGGHWHFQVDHYKPKGLPEFQHLETEYSNLLYSCDHCNNMKWNIWVSDDPIADGIGWLDPCEHDLDEHYYYGYKDGKFTLISLTKVGKWMATTLALDQPARIRRRESLAKEEILDTQTLEVLRVFLEKSEINGEQEAAREYAELIQKFEEKIKNRYTPEPFETLHRVNKSHFS